jgi:hypothetical protein
MEHLPRVSTWQAELADRLSREVTTTPDDKNLLETFEKGQLLKSLADWMSNPCDDWSLPEKVLYEVIRKL